MIVAATYPALPAAHPALLRLALLRLALLRLACVRLGTTHLVVRGGQSQLASSHLRERWVGEGAAPDTAVVRTACQVTRGMHRAAGANRVLYRCCCPCGQPPRYSEADAVAGRAPSDRCVGEGARHCVPHGHLDDLCVLRLAAPGSQRKRHRVGAQRLAPNRRISETPRQTSTYRGDSELLESDSANRATAVAPSPMVALSGSQK